MAFRKITCVKIDRESNEKKTKQQSLFTKEEKNKNNLINDSDCDESKEIDSEYDFEKNKDKNNVNAFETENDNIENNIENEENYKREKKEILIQGTKNRYAIKNQAPIQLPVIQMPRKIVIETMSKIENLHKNQLSLSKSFETNTNTSLLLSSSSSFMNGGNLGNMFDYNFQLQMIDEMIHDEELGKEREENERYDEIKSIFKREVKKKISSYRQQDILKDYKKNKEKKYNSNKNKNAILSICKVGWIKEEEEKENQDQEQEAKQEQENKNYKNELNCFLQKTKGEKEKKDSINDLTFLNVLKLMKEQQNKCFYCNQECFLFYAHVREMNQWTLDRINNEMSHVVGNLIIACLECNIVRRRRSMKNFSESKHIQHNLRLVNHFDSTFKDEREKK